MLNPDRLSFWISDWGPINVGPPNYTNEIESPMRQDCA